MLYRSDPVPSKVANLLMCDSSVSIVQRIEGMKSCQSKADSRAKFQ